MNEQQLVGDVMVGGCLGHNDHKMLEFSIVELRTVTLDYQWAEFDLF